ncbi:C40 family peptidase [Candidatus Clostridium stratigraminis]|uniref:C40 family peptidase n=1 Tax=Candidatus Clostridium stratigraminis TaxID=3381661 RepID=A0ABW8T6C5_9CLOT
MKYSIAKPLLFAAALVAFGISARFNGYIVKADAAIKDQPSVVVRSASLNTDKVIKVPQKTEQKTSSTKSKTLSRGGGSGITGGAPASAGNSSVVSYAYKFLGKPYVWGASGPNAFDCSGFTAYVYRAFGVGLGHYTGTQFGSGQSVSKGNLAPGDLVFFNTYGSVSHVGIYVGGGNFIHAANSRTGVTVSSLSEGYYASRYAGARRVN